MFSNSENYILLGKSNFYLWTQANFFFYILTQVVIKVY